MDSLFATIQAGLSTTYQVERELGGGGMSRVFLARDPSLERQVVVKVLSAEMSEGASADRFRREVLLTAKLQHPLIVPVLSTGDVNGMLYYAMPYIAGDSLRARLQREGRLAVDDCVRVLRDVLTALDFAHANGVVHRDIKPENILLGPGHALVADFGVARALRASTVLTSTGISIGTPAYMSPEQAAGDPSVDHRADLYAVGVLAYELLAGEPPFTGTPAQVLTAHMTKPPAPITGARPDVPPALSSMIAHALEKDPAKRPQSAREMLEVLEAAGSRERSAGKRGPRTWRGWSIAAAAAIALGLVGWRLVRPSVAASARSIAIIPLAVADGDTSLTRLAQNLVTLVSNNLDGIGEIRVADPMAVLSHAAGIKTFISSADALRISKALNARSAVYGTLVRNGAQVRIDAGVYEVASPTTPVARISVIGQLDSLSTLTDSLTSTLLRQIWARGKPPTANVGSITTHSQTALREFLEGERRFAHYDLHGAGDSYRRAVLADTTFYFAAWRYQLARNWVNEPVEDTSIVSRLGRHRADLPERDRMLLATTDSSPTQTEYLRRLRELTTRFPDYAPGWVILADQLTHHFVRSGHDPREAISPWRRAMDLMPTDLSIADHVFVVCLDIGDRECARHELARYDSLVRLDTTAFKGPKVAARTMRLSIDGPGNQTPADFFAHSVRDSTPPSLSGGPTLVFMAPALVDQPAVLAFSDSVTRLFASFPRLPDIFRNFVRAYLFSGFAARGDWRYLDSTDALLKGQSLPPNFLPERERLRARILAELQGAAPPSAGTAELANARLVDPESSPVQRAEARWIIAANALARGDSADVGAQLSELQKDTIRAARVAVRSLRALANGLGGNKAAAAESLLVLEREHGERTVLWPAFAIDRLLGAQWLTELHRPAPADSLLLFTKAFGFASTAEVTWPIYAAAMLQESRIAEAMGNKEEAVRTATIFLRVSDHAPPERKPQLDEARQRIARLGGLRDATGKAQP